MNVPHAMSSTLSERVEHFIYDIQKIDFLKYHIWYINVFQMKQQNEEMTQF